MDIILTGGDIYNEKLNYEIEYKLNCNDKAINLSISNFQFNLNKFLLEIESFSGKIKNKFKII